MEYQRALLKQSVKQSIRQTRPRPIWLTLLTMVVTAVGTALIQRILSGLNWSNTIFNYYFGLILEGADPEEAANMMVRWILSNGAQIIVAVIFGSLVVSFVTYLWQSLMDVGYEGYCLAMVRGQSPSVPNLFCAFPRIGGVLLTRILTWVFVFLWTLLFTVGLIVVLILGAGLATAVPFLGALLMLAGIIAYFVAVIWVSLRYALADYILLDQGVSGLAAVRMSKEMMQGNIGRLFVLQLSFIGWYLIMLAVAFAGILIMAAVLGGIGAAVSLGGMHGLGGFYAVIGVVWIFILIIFIVELIIMLWLRPYITGCVAKFYDFLRGSQPLNQGGWSGPGGGDPWDRKTREQKDAWDYSSYTWSSGRPSNPAGNLNPPAPQDQTEAQGGGKGGSQGGTEEPPQDGQPPRGPNYPKY